MPSWTAEAVTAAAADWVWVPPEAEQIRTDDYQLIAYPTHLQHPTRVARSASARPPGDLIDEVTAHVRAWHRDSVWWWVRADTRPADTEAVLQGRGGTLAETVQVLAYDLADGVPDFGLPGDPPALRAELVRDEATLAASVLVNDEVWDERRERTAGDGAAELAEIQAQLAAWSGYQIVVYADGEPAATGGCTIVDGVARLWGAGARPALRGRGAYRLLLTTRIGLAREHGATMALVKGRVETSAPILRRAGFIEYGEERSYRLPA
ncbi:MAG: GNAT family N-acetyltransferase [Streptosporangiaceae bacterium]